MKPLFSMNYTFVYIAPHSTKNRMLFFWRWIESDEDTKCEKCVYILELDRCEVGMYGENISMVLNPFFVERVYAFNSLFCGLLFNGLWL